MGTSGKILSPIFTNDTYDSIYIFCDYQKFIRLKGSRLFPSPSLYLPTFGDIYLKSLRVGLFPRVPPFPPSTCVCPFCVGSLGVHGPVSVLVHSGFHRGLRVSTPLCGDSNVFTLFPRVSVCLLPTLESNLYGIFR